MRDGRRYTRGHPDWRPFVGVLAPTSQRQAFVILNTLFSWLVYTGYLAGNPLSLTRRRTRKAVPCITRYLSEDLWAQVKLTIVSLPRESSREREQYLRIRWLFPLLYLCGLRISEVVDNTMGSFCCRRDKDGEDRWWLEVKRKGHINRIVPATNELMGELARYRCEKSLTPIPSQAENIPLLLPIGNQQRYMTRGAVHAIVKQIFEKTAIQLRLRGTEFDALPNQVKLASAHWLRHTAGSRMANSEIELGHVQNNLGHKQIHTTSVYLHSTDYARCSEIEGRQKMKW
jgi:integrase/recombinase XerD